LLGKFDPSEREDFVTVPAEYNVAGYKSYLRKETMDAFEDMAEAADKDEVELNIASATRNFDYQKDLWDKKWEGITLVDGGKLPKTVPDEFLRFEKILEYSAVPGTSRHHWGTDIDIDSAIPEYFNTKKGEKIYDWLVLNAPSFGFCEPYNQKDIARPSGYNEEKWHWSYMPLSKQFTEDYKKLITDSDIKGFDGDEHVPNFNLINNYVEDINPECL
jgi:LAS superfamily LD-carboxypeptidase LdcB